MARKGRIGQDGGVPASTPVPRFLPTTLAEAGGIPPDVVLVTGDAYVDDPSFGVAVVGRWLEAHGFTVGVIAQPRWDGPEAFRALGRPRLFFGVTAGNLDSVVNARTAAGKVRNDDAYSPGGRPGLRPERATIAYTARCHEAFSGVPVVLGGVEASLRRLAHWDFATARIRRSILVDAKADLLVHGMGERAVFEIARRLAAGFPLAACRDIPGTAWVAGERESVPDGREVSAWEALEADSGRLADLTRALYEEAHPSRGRTLVQRYGRRSVVCLPPAEPLSPEELDRVHTLPYARAPHPSYTEPIPAFEAVRGSITVTRGCAGGCAFCAITLHQGRHVTSRTPASVEAEVRSLAAAPGWRGTIADVGGPTANLYGMGCQDPATEATCRRASCLHPAICPHLRTDHGPYRALLARLAALPGVKHVFVGSGIRHDLAIRDPGFVRDLAAYHTSGRLTVAPEHAAPAVLRAMRKPPWDTFLAFRRLFDEGSGRLHGALVVYLIAAHPGAGPEEAVALALALKDAGLQPRQAQLFVPTPSTLATAMYVTGRDPLTGEPVPVARDPRDRARQRALLYAWKREAWPEVREALRAFGRPDLIGYGPGCLVPPGSIRAAWRPRPEERSRRGGHDREDR
ncbi:MAG: YgiQ family radical SAM protein [Deltaproteobacteria bacterium]|nr:YgiQ family radical SAM protein [Deltaproteobacteria bacterium]